MTACTGRHSNRIVVQNENFTLTGDSLIEGDVIATASTEHFIESTLTRERLDSIAAAYSATTGNDRSLPTIVGGKPWHGNDTGNDYPKYKSRQRLVNALHNMSIDHIAAASTGNTFSAQGDTIALYCAIYLSLAHLQPERSMRTLRSMVSNEQIAPSSHWPAGATRLTWAMAAWEVYKATADKQWLAFMHNVLDNSLSTDTRLLQDHATHLMHGFCANPSADFYPIWMEPIDMVETMPLLTSVVTLRAMEILNNIDEELNVNHQHNAHADRLKAAINQQLWSERRGMYSAYLYGCAYHLRAPIADNMAQALAVLWDIADDDRALTLVAKTPVTHHGIPVIFPWAPAVEPYFSHNMWPAVQALWIMAAASVNNDDMVRTGIASLLRAQALFQSRHITVQDEPRNDLVTAAANQAVMLRVIAGLNFLADGIEIMPHVPSCFTGSKTIKGLKCHRATLDITIDGTGNNVKSITLDGNAVEGNFIAATLTGHHTINVTVENGKTNHGITIAKQLVALPQPPDIVWTADSGFITDYVTGGRYMIITNGRFNYSIGNIAFAIPHNGKTVEASAARANKYGFGFMARPHLFIHSDMKEINLKSAQTTDSIAVEVTTRHAGTHFLQIDYMANAHCDAINVGINSHDYGTLILPPFHADTLLSSNIISVQLLRGKNHVVLRRDPAMKSATAAKPVTLRIISQ